MVCLKSGHTCVRIFGESPDFFGKVLFLEKGKSPEFSEIFKMPFFQKLKTIKEPLNQSQEIQKNML